MHRFLAALMVIPLAGTLAAAEYFADAVNGNDANDGRTEATAKLSLKAALALADTGDTVTLLPGDYTNGVETTSSTYSRGYINKQITLRSKNGRASRDVTRIVGKYDYAGGTGTGKTGGMGDNCVRGLWVTSAAAGTVVEGISFVDCSAPFLTGSGESTSGGGIFFGNGGLTSTAADNLYVVDCAFIRCQATRGAGMYGGTSVRCLFKSCRHTKFGAGQRAGSSYNSVFDDCHVVPGLGQDSMIGGGVLGYMRYVVNCTVVNCEPRLAANLTGNLVNCIFQNNGDQTLPQERTFNCVTDTSTMTSNGCAVSVVYGMAEVWSPMDDDYRVNAGAKALTKGSADWLAQIPAAYRDTDYYGNPRVTDGTVYCGAVQAVAGETGSGVAFRLAGLEGTLKVDGEPVTAGYRTWFQRTGWPFTVRLAFESDSPTRGLVRYTLSETSFWPLQDDTLHLLPDQGHVKTIAVEVGNVVHVDPVAGDDANNGSAENPYRTLQKAVDCTADTLVLAHAGDYAEGEKYWSGSNRVYVSTKRLLRVKAVAGAESTFITGAADPEPAIANNYGLGPKAVRCIGVDTNGVCCFQGFTLRDGHASYNTDNTDTDAVHGGALLNGYGTSSKFNGVLADCLITNCVVSRGIAFGGVLQRCRVTGCNAVKLGLLRSCRAVASVFDHNPGTGGSIVSQSAEAYNCTFVTNGCAALSSGYGKAYGCVMGWRNASDVSGTPAEMKFCVYASKAGGVSIDGSNVQENPIKFVSPETDDWRLLSTSAGVTLGYLSRLTGIGYAPVSFDGTPFVITDGRVPAGAFNIREAATNYVDAVNGNDATADGTTEATAYKTLAAALAAAKSGDTVVALPGTYAEGSAVPTKAQAASSTVPTIAARAVVPSRVTLESRDGPEATVIEGARATVDANSYGCGADAVRCVYLCQYATVRGFTLYNGHTDSGGSGYANSVDTRGGGVGVANDSSVANGQNSLVENCIITNCTAARGAGGFCGTYRKCKFFDNNAPKPGTAIYWGVVEGCFFDNNPGHSIIYKSPVWNSTILATAKGNIAAVNNEGTHTDTHQPIVNTILGTSSYVSSNLVNCAYSSTAHNRWPDAPNVNPAVGDLLIGIDGAPLAGSVAIDAGDMSQTLASLGDTDLAGGQRVYNGAMDIGCYEYDWRPKYAADLGKGVTVASASPEVLEGAGGVVTLLSGSLEAGWSNASGRNRGYVGNAQVTGTGTLEIMHNGESFKTVTAADGPQTFRFYSSLALEQLTFSYTPGENDDGAALLSSFAIDDGFMIILR